MGQKKTLVIFDFDGIIVEECHQRNMLMSEWGLWKIVKLYFDDFDGKEKKVAANKTREIGVRTLDNLILKKDAVDLSELPPAIARGFLRVRFPNRNACFS